MRSYNRKFVNKEIKNVAEQSLELQNGIVWSIDTTEHNCGVKLLGSDDIITVDFPPSWMVVPNWVQLGCPVQMAHRYGFRNTLEIINPGHIIPAQTTGNNTPTLDPSILPDSVLDGCAVNEIDLVPQMAVMVQTGSVRIGGSTIVVDAIKMDTTVYSMDMGGKMNNVAAIATISTSIPLLNGELRYDLLSVGTDAAVDYTKGTTFMASVSTATISTLAQGHVEIARILLSSITTAVYDKDIDRVYSSSVPVSVQISSSDTDLSATQNIGYIWVGIQDQYQNDIIKKTGKGWQIELEIISGSGMVFGTESFSTTTAVSYCTTALGRTLFIYNRTTADSSPVFRARLISPPLENMFSMIIRTSDGEVATS